MNKYKTQSGFAHLMVITVILGVGLLGALGYIFYQNSVAKSSDSSKNSDVKNDSKPKENLVSDNSKPAVIAESKNTFKIPEWNIKGEYAGSSPITYAINTAQGAARFNSSAVSADCHEGVAVIVRLAPDDSAAKSMVNGGYFNPESGSVKASEAFAKDSYSETYANKHVGGYYYIIATPAQYCSPADEIIQKNIFKDVMSYFKTIEEIK